MNSLELTDLHCHLLPYVDDGAYDLAESRRLLRAEVEQGVRTICFTPHLRKDMFETADEVIDDSFRQVAALVEEQGLPLRLYYSREYHYDRLFRARLESGNIRPLGEGKTLLVEFGHRHGPSAMREAVALVQSAGYRPLIAHVERYEPIQNAPEIAEELVELGALLQINAGSVLGREGQHQKRLVWKLMKRDLVCAIGSDAHDTEIRTPELGSCAKQLERKLNRAYAARVMNENPLGLLRP